MAVKRGDLGGLTCPEMVQFHPQMSKFQKIVQNEILIARSKKLEQGNLLSQPAPFLFYLHDPPPFFRCLTASVQLGFVSLVLSPMSTWLKQKPIKNRWQPLPHQIALLPIGTLAGGTQKKNHFPVSKITFRLPHICVSRAGQSFKPKSAFLSFLATQPSTRALS